MKKTTRRVSSRRTLTAVSRLHLSGSFRSARAPPDRQRRSGATLRIRIHGVRISRSGFGFVPLLFGGTVRVRFGECTLDSDTRELSRGGEPVHLEPKAYRLLELLMAARPKALSKRDLQEELWPKTYVSERS